MARISRSWLVMALTIAACTRSAFHVTDVPGPHVADDPAVRGDWLAVTAPADGGEANPDEADAPFTKIHWLPRSEIDLAPGAAQTFTVSLAVPSLVLSRAMWYGAGGRLTMSLSKADGATLAEGETLAIDDSHGAVVAHARVDGTGDARVSVRNAGTAAVKVRVIAGALALSEAEGRP